MPMGIPTKETQAETEIHPVTGEAKASVQHNLIHCIFLKLLTHFDFFI